MTEDEKQEVDTLLKVLDHITRRHEWRANMEWKITLAVWTFLLAGSGFFISQKIALPWILSLALPLPILTFHFLWLKGMYAGHEYWKARLDYWFEKVELLASGSNPAVAAAIPSSRPVGRKVAFYKGGMPLYLAVTIILSMIFAFGPLLVRASENSAVAPAADHLPPAATSAPAPAN